VAILVNLRQCGLGSGELLRRVNDQAAGAEAEQAFPAVDVGERRRAEQGAFLVGQLVDWSYGDVGADQAAVTARTSLSGAFLTPTGIGRLEVSWRRTWFSVMRARIVSQDTTAAT
jgi:hypothetical protein